MKNVSICLASCAAFLLSGCNGNDLTKNKPAAVFQPTPGNPDNCVIYIPYRYSDFGGSLSGSLTAAQVPGGSASIKGNTNWGFVPYAGKCGEPSTWQKIGTPGAETPKPEKSPPPSKDDKSKSIAAKANQVGTALVAATSAKKPEAKSAVSSLIAESVPFYAALNKYAELRPYQGNKTPADKVIAALRKAAGGSTAHNAPQAARAPSASAMNADPQSISDQADQLTKRLTSLR